MITNCGYFQNYNHKLNILSKSTAAHSTLSIDDRSSCKFKKDKLGYFTLENTMNKIKVGINLVEDDFDESLTKKKYEQIMKISSKAHSLIGCRGVTRSDFKYYRGKFYLLEINTQPGMTKLSLVPEIAAFRGISFIKLIELILKDASTNK